MADKSRLTELTKALETKTREIQEAANAFKVEDNGGVVVTTEVKNAYLKTVAEAKEIRELIDAERTVDSINEWKSAPAGGSISQSLAVEQARGDMEMKSLADVVLESESFRNQVKSPAPYIKVDLDTSLFDFEQKDIYGTSTGRVGGDLTLPTFGRALNLGITDVRLRQRHVRDLFPVARTDAAVLYGIRETGFVNNAAVVPVRTGGASGGMAGDFALKPMSNLLFEPVQFPVATIAHLLRAHRNILADEPRLRDFINRRMVDGVKLAEDAEIMYGTGSGESITGIMNTPGVQSFTGSASDPLSAQLRRAATLAMISEYQPNGVVLHPTSWEDLELEATADGNYRLAVNVAVGGQPRVWNMDIVQTTAITAGEFLLGNFGLGATLYDREQVGVMISTEDSDNFRRNAVTIRAEERIALEVSRPESFVAGTLTPYVP